jgi:hypothetical protein
MAKRDWKRLNRELAELRALVPPGGSLSLPPLDEPEPEVEEFQDAVLDALDHIHEDLIAIRAHLGIARSECGSPSGVE